MFKRSRYLGNVMEILQMFKGKNSTSCVISLSGTMACPQNSSDKKNASATSCECVHLYHSTLGGPPFME